MGAFFASCAFMLCSPYGIMALSYNSMGLMFLILSAVLLVTANERNSIFAISGFLFAGAVLCSPYVIMLYLIYSLVFLVRKRKKIYWISFSIGAATLAAAFSIYLAGRIQLADIKEIILAIMSDPEHGGSTLEKTFSYFKVFLGAHENGLLLFIIEVSLFLLIQIDRKSKTSRKPIYLIAAVVIDLFYLRPFAQSACINYLMMPLNILGFFVYLLSGNERLKKWFQFVWIPGIFY